MPAEPGPPLGERDVLPSWSIIEGDARGRLAELPGESAQCCVTSPPYYGLRDYGMPGQVGLEQTPDEYVQVLVEIFREVRRVLAEDGTLWLNLGDSYNTRQRGSDNGWDKSRLNNPARIQKAQAASLRPRPSYAGSKPKDLLGIPWMVAFALRADGWWLRQEIIWHKRTPMPESVQDRCTRAHEQVFMLTRSPRYFYDAAAVREPDSGQDHARTVLDGQPSLEPSNGISAPHRGLRTPAGRDGLGRNKRSVWTLSSRPFPEAHFATFPPELPEPCILAGSRAGDTVLDPFSGAGTVGMVALRHGRSYVGIELNPEYAALSRRRIADDAPLLNGPAEVVENAA